MRHLVALGVVIVTVMGLAVAGCHTMSSLDRQELALCREIVPKASILVDELKVQVDHDKIVIGLCNDLNSALRENRDLVEPPQKSKKKYRGTGERVKS